LAHALAIAKAKVDGDPNYNSYRRGYKIRPVVDRLLETTGIDLSRGGGVPELLRFQEHFKEYRIVVFGGLNCEDIIFDGQVESKKELTLCMITYLDIFMLLTALRVRCRDNMSVEVVINGVDVA